MLIQIDFDSNEAIYRQLCRQIIMEIATQTLQEGDSLPSVRDMASEIGINMHTVNKAYGILREEGFLTIDRKNGAVVAIDFEKMRALDDLEESLSLAVAKARCRGISRKEMHQMLDQVYDAYEENTNTEKV